MSRFFRLLGLFALGFALTLLLAAEWSWHYIECMKVGHSQAYCIFGDS